MAVMKSCECVSLSFSASAGSSESHEQNYMKFSTVQGINYISGVIWTQEFLTDAR